MTQWGETRRAVVHLVAVWLAGCALTGMQVIAVLAALFSGGAAPLAALLAGVVLMAVAVLAALGSAVRTMVPLLRRPRGLWAWTAGVYALGTAGASGAAVVYITVNRLDRGLLLYAVGGACYMVAAALFLPGTRVRLGALGAAAALAAGVAYTTWAAAQPPTLGEWISANGVDRGMLRVGDPPPGYTLRGVGASEDGFSAHYARPRSEPLHLGVERAGHDTRRVDARDCPVPRGDPIRCTDDGGGRQLRVYEGDYEHWELRLRRDGLVYTVAGDGSPTDRSAARHILSTLRPATDAELAGLTELPMRR
ncbi:hypothetical protein [Streptomyces xinghaiensis]|uniref:hypothetical protein n=1 Tax=Streptomyces xinghaiensis TaxID=1038928 RepID=UPI0012FFA215|nr:hypothetical protein [Streptomyces xinghaiensis]MZE77651.1 hypothetical protein [Streptomyces sp. SID5475]